MKQHERIRVLVLMGGPDAEREVSLQSGREIASALRRNDQFEVFDEVIDRPQCGELGGLIDECRAQVVFPILHGPWGEGGPLQELLEEIGITYVGSRPRPSKLAMDKLAAKAIFTDANIPTPPSQLLSPHDVCDLNPPLVFKPVDDGSSIDLRICRTSRQVEAARRELHPRRPRLMAEEYIQGRELTVSILCGEALPVIEIIPAVEFYDYDAKYVRDDTRYVVNPDLPEGVAQRCQSHALLAFLRLGCRDLARVDFMLDDRGPWLLEINTAPGFTTHSLLPMAAADTGRDMASTCALLVETALARADIAPSPFSPERQVSNPQGFSG